MDYRRVFEYDFGFQIKWGSNGWGIGRCPNPHHEDKNPSCSFNEDNGVIYCHSCGYFKSAYSYAKEHGYDNPYKIAILIIFAIYIPFISLKKNIMP